MINLRLEKSIGAANFTSLNQFSTFASLERWFKAKSSNYTMVDNPIGMKYRIKASAANMSKVLKIKSSIPIELFFTTKSDLSVNLVRGRVSIS